ncbi:hypothetical protein LN650_30505 [Klebsiella pneumoniae subsp. pneumoniae]|nr:hypothetical protein [Klebsiella pneumoniae subsp. pneumoniae]
MTRYVRRSTPYSSTTRSATAWTWGIVNAGQLAIYDDLPGELRDAVEDVILNRRDDSTERLRRGWRKNIAAAKRTTARMPSRRSGAPGK